MTNNELIAEFIGFQKTNLGWFDNEETMNFKSDGNTYGSYELKFHSSWDWLMPVIEKIYDEGSFDNELVLLIRDSVAELNLKNTYESIIDYLNKIK